MLYYLAKYLSRIGFRVFFKKIHFSNQEAIPEGKTLIFAVNHPTAFLDPALVGALVPPTVNFIVRGDIFVGKVILKILASLKMYPIFRFRDGFSEMKKNAELMEKLHRFLSEGKHILILAEGQTKHEKRLRPIQKGTARMAFGAVEKYGDLDIAIVPLGINYTDSNQFRSTVMMKVGEAIPLADYLPLYRENAPKATKTLTDEIELRMRKVIVHIADKKDDQLANDWLAMHRNEQHQSALPMVNRAKEPLTQELQRIAQFNAFSAEEKTILQEKVTRYQAALRQHKASDRGIAQVAAYRWTNTLLLILGFPFYLLGYITNALPLIGAVALANKKVKKIEFHSSVRFGAGLVLCFFYWLILVLVLGFSLGWIGLVIALVIPLLGFVALWHRDLLLLWKEAHSFARLSEHQKKELLAQRKNILALSKD